jgi:GDPmannose 4,6-dehydratase
MRRTALITGITGQDGSYLTELLLDRDYIVHGLIRESTLRETQRLWRIQHLLNRIHFHPASIEAPDDVKRVIRAVMPDECYHLASAQSLRNSFPEESATLHTNIQGTHNLVATLLEVVPGSRFYFAGSSEMFGRAEEVPQSEKTRFHPRNAYGVSKVAGFDLVRHYRETYGLHASSGILFNHESPRRGAEFVTRKITSHVARIKRGLESALPLGNLESRRDWGHAREYVRAIWMMLQQNEPADYVIATGQTHSVRDFAELAFQAAGLDYRGYVVAANDLFRPAETHVLCGDSTLARQRLGWRNEIDFAELVREMVAADLAQLT